MGRKLEIKIGINWRRKMRIKKERKKLRKEKKESQKFKIHKTGCRPTQGGLASLNDVL